MYCEYYCCIPCLFIMKVCEECYKSCCCIYTSKIAVETNASENDS